MKMILGCGGEDTDMEMILWLEGCYLRLWPIYYTLAING